MSEKDTPPGSNGPFDQEQYDCYSAANRQEISVNGTNGFVKASPLVKPVTSQKSSLPEHTSNEQNSKEQTSEEKTSKRQSSTEQTSKKQTSKKQTSAE